MEIKLIDCDEISYCLINFDKVKRVGYLPEKELITFYFDDDTTFEFGNEDLFDLTVEDLYNEAKKQLNK